MQKPGKCDRIKDMKKFFAFAVLALVLSSAAPAEAKYIYRPNDAEYSMMLPEAPSAVGIWGDQKNAIPYLTKPPRFGEIGEVATYRRYDDKTGDFMDIKITFLKADRDFLLTRNETNMRSVMEKEVADFMLEDKKFAVSKGEDTIKWATLTGFSVDKKNRALYNAVHYLTGRSTMMVVKVQYSVENEKLNKQYQDLATSIRLAQ